MSNNEIVDWLKEGHNVRPFLPADIQVIELLSVGGQGVVYRGSVNGVEAAVKFYLPGQIDKRIEREIKALKDIQCPTIVNLLWSDRVVFPNHQLNIVATSYVEGTPLDQVIKKGRLEDPQLSILAYDVALAIQAMWEKRIVHRDLKPSNILLRPNNRACVIDLGVARHLNDSSLTQMGATWGTLGYLSPEQRMSARQLTCKSDIFALGVVLLEAATGHHPTFGDQLRLETRRFHVELPHEISGWVHALHLRLMLEPKAISRPSPEDLLVQFSDFADRNKEI